MDVLPRPAERQSLGAPRRSHDPGGHSRGRRHRAGAEAGASAAENVSQRARQAGSGVSKFLAAADAYPDTTAGIAARYHAAATLAALGRQAEARQRYAEVIDRDGRGVYGKMAKLGQAELNVQEKRVRPGDCLIARAVIGHEGRRARRCRAVATWCRLPGCRQEGRSAADVPAHHHGVAASQYTADARKQLNVLKATS